jgi:hypothetical protein
VTTSCERSSLELRHALCYTSSRAKHSSRAVIESAFVRTRLLLFGSFLDSHFCFSGFSRVETA